MSLELKFNDGDVIVTVDSDGGIEHAEVYNHIIHDYFDCTDHVIGSSTWVEKIREEFNVKSEAVKWEDEQNRRFDVIDGEGA